MRRVLLRFSTFYLFNFFIKESLAINWWVLFSHYSDIGIPDEPAAKARQRGMNLFFPLFLVIASKRCGASGTVVEKCLLFSLLFLCLCMCLATWNHCGGRDSLIESHVASFALSIVSLSFFRLHVSVVLSLVSFARSLATNSREPEASTTTTYTHILSPSNRCTRQIR